MKGTINSHVETYLLASISLQVYVWVLGSLKYFKALPGWTSPRMRMLQIVRWTNSSFLTYWKCNFSSPSSNRDLWPDFESRFLSESKLQNVAVWPNFKFCAEQSLQKMPNVHGGLISGSRSRSIPTNCTVASALCYVLSWKPLR